MNITALIIAYLMAGFGFFSVNKTKDSDEKTGPWHNPIACALLWPMTLIKSPWRGAFFGSLLNGVIVYFIVAFLLSYV